MQPASRGVAKPLNWNAPKAGDRAWALEGTGQCTGCGERVDEQGEEGGRGAEAVCGMCGGGGAAAAGHAAGTLLAARAPSHMRNQDRTLLMNLQTDGSGQVGKTCCSTVQYIRTRSTCALGGGRGGRGEHSCGKGGARTHCCATASIASFVCCWQVGEAGGIASKKANGHDALSRRCAVNAAGRLPSARLTMGCNPAAAGCSPCKFSGAMQHYHTWTGDASMCQCREASAAAAHVAPCAAVRDMRLQQQSFQQRSPSRPHLSLWRQGLAVTGVRGPPACDCRCSSR